MLTTTGIILLILSIALSIPYIRSSRTKLFDKYFQVDIEESYNLVDLYPIKITGTIRPTVDYLDIPYEDLDIVINTKTIRGTIVNNKISLELIQLSDRRKALYLIKKHYTKAVQSYITETLTNKKQFIELINISSKEKRSLEKIACNTCKHRLNCPLEFNKCTYERETKDIILSKGIKVNTTKNYELNSTTNY
ncbi:hypothetical protein RH915_02900 [Serpentinicella sp. ANB-PHB4]|uniref:hypothetical protein n=1 Tax=Serpentinicella sp. ANB-PHB4 TaxID=3074076 RepID=UPI0028654F35|nr:hypothetical protein [Serpentinicella sp. ANB-PHB4]MDR5658430.1 hypothetical protein [Serpentinicella sp. ANB-PHB4]